jgi:hypothetical protein
MSSFEEADEAFRCLGLIISAALLAAASATASVQREVSLRPTTRVTVVAKEHRFSFSRRSAPLGVVIFTLINKGVVVHALEFPLLGKSTPVLQPGAKARLTISFKRRGRFYWLCPIAEHSELGEAGAFIIR